MFHYFRLTLNTLAYSCLGHLAYPCEALTSIKILVCCISYLFHVWKCHRFISTNRTKEEAVQTKDNFIKINICFSIAYAVEEENTMNIPGLWGLLYSWIPFAVVFPLLYCHKKCSWGEAKQFVMNLEHNNSKDKATNFLGVIRTARNLCWDWAAYSCTSYFSCSKNSI